MITMREPNKYKLTHSPEAQKVNLIPLSPLKDRYPESMSDDIYIKQQDINSNEDTTKSPQALI